MNYGLVEIQLDCVEHLIPCLCFCHTKCVFTTPRAFVIPFLGTQKKTRALLDVLNCAVTFYLLALTAITSLGVNNDISQPRPPVQAQRTSILQQLKSNAENQLIIWGLKL